ncbi:hypothetical protein M3699_21085 [Peribacillus simplex]|uniref:hypothetical protein n=1 Tax=Peribacillus simplex TaxID=1478 RepID=UPI00203BDE0E|nr:hypothetical protein [Peribacillus simplex]MCM3676285.1 hypothetical protein [Peribacillus simplex]
MKTRLQFIYGCIFSFYEDVLTEEILKSNPSSSRKKEQALILQMIEGLFININFSFEFAIVHLLLFMVFSVRPIH